MTDKVAIVGYSPTMYQAPFNDEQWDIFSLNYRFDRIPRFTKWFDVHGEACIRSIPNYYQFLRNNQQNVVLAAPIEGIEGAEIYPQKEVMDRFGDFFTNSISWMICYAIVNGYKEIALYGIDLACKEEYVEQRPSVLYFLGIAVGLGIKITLPPACKLFEKKKFYWLGP